jgi:diguanylate cyclase (GGDEF)-like protein/putative nucleotidyltransferase with HDIG domain
MASAASTMGRNVIRHKRPIAWTTLSVVALAVTGVALTSAVNAWRVADDAARARNSYMLLRAGAAHEEALLRKLRRSPESPEVRKTFFAATQAQSALLTSADSHSPKSQVALLHKIERQHTVALGAAARALQSVSQSRLAFSDALRMFRAMQLSAAIAQGDLGVAAVRPWPATRTQVVELGGVGVVLLIGIVVLGRQIARAAGLRPNSGSATEIERLLHAARSDSLTGLANHRAFQDDLSAAIDRRNAQGIPFSLLAFDLDGLKRVNDIEGHPAGDAFIKTVAACIRDALAESGTVYRTGGDEFMALLPTCRGWQALTVAHRIQRLASEATGKRALSIGVTESTRTEGSRVLLHQADLALYEAKRAKLLAVSYHEGLAPRAPDGIPGGPNQQQKALAAALAQAVDARDAGTRNHSETVAELCVAVGARLGFTGERLERLRIAGLLHDVGKIGVSDTVLTKPGALAEKERAEIELHATVGHAILTSAGLPQEAGWVLHHHERLDGTGYPGGVVGDAIPIESRIIAVADAFEAMTGSRAYRQAVTPEDALAELAAHSGTQFDPRCVRVLNDVFGGGALVAADAVAGHVETVAVA